MSCHTAVCRGETAGWLSSSVIKPLPRDDGLEGYVLPQTLLQSPRLGQS